MDLGISEELKDIREKIRAFVYEKVTPVEQEYMKAVSYTHLTLPTICSV